MNKLLVQIAYVLTVSFWLTLNAGYTQTIDLSNQEYDLKTGDVLRYQSVVTYRSESESQTSNVKILYIISIAIKDHGKQHKDSAEVAIVSIRFDSIELEIDQGNKKEKYSFSETKQDAIPNSEVLRLYRYVAGKTFASWWQFDEGMRSEIADAPSGKKFLSEVTKAAGIDEIQMKEAWRKNPRQPNIIRMFVKNTQAMLKLIAPKLKYLLNEPAHKFRLDDVYLEFWPPTFPNLDLEGKSSQGEKIKFKNYDCLKLNHSFKFDIIPAKVLVFERTDNNKVGSLLQTVDRTEIDNASKTNRPMFGFLFEITENVGDGYSLYALDRKLVVQSKLKQIVNRKDIKTNKDERLSFEFESTLLDDSRLPQK